MIMNDKVNVKECPSYCKSRIFSKLFCKSTIGRNMFDISWNSAPVMTSLVTPVAVQHLSVLTVNNLIHDLVLARVGDLKISPGN